MSLPILAEDLKRIEHKLDAVLKAFDISCSPMHFTGQICPACKKNIEYQIDVSHQVVKRICGCSTGKVPSIPLILGEAHGSSESRKK